MIDQASRVFEALASLPRRKILAYLSAGPLTVGEIGTRFDFSKPTLSSHLNILEAAGLIHKEREGQFIRVSLQRDALMNTVMDWASEVCPVARPIKKERQRKST